MTVVATHAMDGTRTRHFRVWRLVALIGAAVVALGACAGSVSGMGSDAADVARTDGTLASDALRDGGVDASIDAPDVATDVPARDVAPPTDRCAADLANDP